MVIRLLLFVDFGWSPAAGGGLPLAAGDRILVGEVRVDAVVVGLEPLHELEVVLLLGLDEFVHVDLALDAVLEEQALQNLLVLNLLLLLVGAPFHLRHGHLVRLHDVKHLARHMARGGLFNFGNV